ncbi:MAG: hypothetical protein CEO40_245 [Parcubacteria group bacterium LiPW_72]|nr:MAG: hypothetical protein CEO40_245 [Parcubacteria group bacterium LiPW_72]
MEWIFIAFLIFLLGILCGGGYILQRDKYWKRVWEELGKPEVSGIKELKKL